VYISDVQYKKIPFTLRTTRTERAYFKKLKRIDCELSLFSFPFSIIDYTQDCYGPRINSEIFYRYAMHISIRVKSANNAAVE